MEFQSDALVLSHSDGKHNHVRQVFENTSRYLRSRSVDIRFRRDTVAEFAANLRQDRVLDIGCGDGTISLQLVRPDSRFTLMDISSSMIATARSHVPGGLGDQVEFRNENFADASFGDEKFDLIITVGVLAHVDSPDAFLEKIKGLLKPGGRLIIEFTDAYHFVGRVGRGWGWLKEVIAPARYPTNKLSYAKVAALFTKHDFELMSMFRYARVPIPGFNLVVNHAREYRLMKWLFGNSQKNANAWMGNEYICHLKVD